MGLRARILTDFDILVTGVGDLAPPYAPLPFSIRQAFDTGGGANQAHMAFGDVRTVNGEATDSLDLAGGLPGALGGNLTFTAIKEMFFAASGSNGGDLLVGEGISNAFEGPFGASAVGLRLPPGGIIHLRNPGATGWAVTAGTGDLVPVKNLHTSACGYTAILIGETA